METETICNTRCNTPFLLYGLHTQTVGLEPVTCLSKARISYSYRSSNQCGTVDQFSFGHNKVFAKLTFKDQFQFFKLIFSFLF